MKPLFNSISPFIFLVLPLVVAIILSLSHHSQENIPEVYGAACYFKMPDFGALIQTAF